MFRTLRSPLFRVSAAAALLLAAFACPAPAANVIVPAFKASLLGASPSINLTSDNIKVALVRGYTYAGTHQYLSDVTGAGGGTVVATSANLTGKTVAGGVFDADDFSFTAVPSGAACQHLVIYKDTGTATTSPLVLVLDTINNFPITPNGGDLNITWSNAATKIFAL